MHTRNRYLVTGATGNVGLETAAHLLARGEQVRALVRDTERGRARILEYLSQHPRFTAAEGAEERLECRAFDFLTDKPTPSHFDGVTGIFLMRPPQIGDVKRYMFPFLTCAREAGVDRIVLLSLLGAEKIFFIPHRKLEKEILRLDFRSHFLRAGFFMQNLDTVFDRFIREEDELPVPAGGGRTSFVDARDLGEAAAVLLKDDTSASHAPELTGSEALDYHRVAQMLSEELGREIAYSAPGLREFRRRVTAAGWDPGYTKIVSNLFYTVRFGMASKVTGELPRILGRAPRSMRQYINDYRETWLAREEGQRDG